MKIDPKAPDDHNRIAVLFTIPATDLEEETWGAISIQGLLHHGIPCNPNTGEPYKYHATFVIQ